MCGISDLAIGKRSLHGNRGFAVIVRSNSKDDAVRKAEQCRWAAEEGKASTPAGRALLLAGAALYAAVADWIDEEEESK